MRLGIGLPAAVPGTDMTTLGRWAADSERAGFASVGVLVGAVLGSAFAANRRRRPPIR